MMIKKSRGCKSLNSIDIPRRQSLKDKSIQLVFEKGKESKQKKLTTNYGKEKKRTLWFASFCLIMGLNHRKSLTVLKLSKKSSKSNVAGLCSFIRLKMAMV